MRNDHSVQELKRLVPVEKILACYGASLNGKGIGRCLFPARHNRGDQDPSMYVRNGRVYCRTQQCFGEKGADQFDLVGIMESLQDYKEKKRRVLEIGGITEHGNGQRRIEAAYNYTDETGTMLFQVVRFEPKDFRQRRPDGYGDWIWNLRDTRLVLYRLPDLLKAETVLVVEGEKDVETAHRLGLPDGWAASCNAMGAGKWRPEYSEALAGKRVVILPDDDEPGRRHAQLVADSLKGKTAEIRILTLPSGHDLTDWVEAGATAEQFVALLASASRWEQPNILGPTVKAPWNLAQPAPDFLQGHDNIADMLEARLLAPGCITEIFSPRGIGKTQVAHALGVKAARTGKRVLLLDRDNPRWVVKDRLRHWGAAETPTFHVMGRDQIPPLTDPQAWASFPADHYDLVIIDALDSTAEGIGEQDSAKPSRALAPILDIAHREQGPAVLVLGNTIKSGVHSRGSGVIEDRADICFEVRDATGFTPSGIKDWWLELPAAGADAWGERAGRRKKRPVFRLAFIVTKYRIGEEPDPWIFEVDLEEAPWTLMDVTQDVIDAGESARVTAIQERQRAEEQAVEALQAEVWKRAHEGHPMLKEKDAVPFLTNRGLKRLRARGVLTEGEGRHWEITAAQGPGHPKTLLPLPLKTCSAAEFTNPETMPMTRLSDEAISADGLQSGRRNSVSADAAPNAASMASLFPPPKAFIEIESEEQQEVIEDAY